MQPKPIESRHLIPIDSRVRALDAESIQYLQRLRDQKEHPAETDYDAVHDEASRRDKEESARRSPEHVREDTGGNKVGASEKKESEDKKTVPKGPTGSHLDLEA